MLWNMSWTIFFLSYFSQERKMLERGQIIQFGVLGEFPSQVEMFLRSFLWVRENEEAEADR